MTTCHSAQKYQHSRLGNREMEFVWLRAINQAKVLPFHPQLLRSISKKLIKILSFGTFK